MLDYCTSFQSLQCHENKPWIQWHFVVRLYTTLWVPLHVAIYLFSHALSHTWPKDHIPYTVLVSNWLTNTTWVPSWSARWISHLQESSKSLQTDQGNFQNSAASFLIHSCGIGQPSVYTKVALNNFAASIASPVTAKELGSRNRKQRLKHSQN